jgi:O-antigen/teichoic acid export membrane protein
MRLRVAEGVPVGGSLLRQRVRHGLVSAMLYEGLSVVLSLASMVLLVRLLTPAEYGRAAAAIGVLGLVATFGAAPIVSHALQYPADEEPDWSQYLALALAAQTLTCLLANVVAGIFWTIPAMRGIAPLLHLASVGLLFDAPNLVAVVMARRHLEFTRVKVLASASLLLKLATSVGLAFAGYGAVALIIGGNIMSAVPGAVDLVLVRRFRPYSRWWQPRWPIWTRALRFGSQHLTLGLVATLRGAIEGVVLPTRVGLAGIGLFTRAQALFQTTAGRFAVVVSDLVYPVLPRDAGVPHRFAMLATRYVEAILVLALGGAAFIAVKGPALSRVLYGAKWTEADVFLTPGALASAAAIVAAAAVSVLVAAGRMRSAMQVQGVSALLACGALATVLFGGRLVAYAWALAAAQMAGAIASLYAASPFLRPDWILRSVAPAIATVAGAVAVTVIVDPLANLAGLPGLALSTLTFALSGLVMLRVTAPTLLAELVGVLPASDGIRRTLLMEPSHPHAGPVATSEPGVLP